MHRTRLGIPNKCVESRHGEPKHATLDGHQTNLSIFVRYVANEIIGVTPSKEVLGYCDANWGGDLEDRRFTTGFVFMIEGGAISWSSKRQPTIALSTTEAEYIANTQATKQAIWITKLMMDLGYMEEKKMMVIQCDNRGAISLTKNPTHHAQTKHIDA